MKPSKMTEQQAAALVVDYLTDLGLNVYQEVAMGYGDSISDIVALRGKEIWIIEVKTTWSLELLEQLRVHKRYGHGHRIFAAVPMSRTDRDRQRLFKDCGFGSICIREKVEDPDSWRDSTQIAEMAPRITSKPLPRIMERLEEGHKTHAKAGAPCAKGRWSPFRKTADALAEVVKKTPGIWLSEAMKQIDHHYSSDACARSSMAVWAKAGKVPGVKVIRQGKILALYSPDFHVPAPAPGAKTPLPEWAQPQLKTGT